MLKVSECRKIFNQLRLSIKIKNMSNEKLKNCLKNKIRKGVLYEINIKRYS